MVKVRVICEYRNDFGNNMSDGVGTGQSFKVLELAKCGDR